MEIKNERGYALVTVLLIATILMIIVISAMGQSFNTLKQNSTLEKKSQSTAIAEMGVSYYQALVNNLYTNQDNRNQVSNEIQIEIDKDKNSKSLKTDTEYSQIAAKNMMDIIKNSINEETKVIDPNSNASFSSKILNSTDNSITLLITGSANGDNIGTPLKTTITVSPSVTVVKETGGDNPILSLLYSFQVSKPNTTPIDNLLDPLKKLVQTEILGIDLLTITQNANKLSDKTIFSTGQLIVDGNLNNLENVKLHADDSLSVGKNVQNAEGSTIEATNDIIFNNHLNVTNFVPFLQDPIPSYLYVGRDLTVEGNLTLSNGAFAYVGRNATINGKITIGPDSLLCVAGTLTVDKKVQGPTENIITLASSLDLQKKCGFNPNASGNITWQDGITNSVDYEY